MRSSALPMRPFAEVMEERVLHSADIAPLLLSSSVVDLAPLRLTSSVGTSALAPIHELVFVDLSVPRVQDLLDDLYAQRDAGRPIEVITIDADQDGVAVISRTLATNQGITAVHVLAHGSDGSMQLGSTTLDAASLLVRANEIAGWSAALTDDADLLLYGCDLAQTELGQGLIANLALLSGADVAASTDLTGAASLGGNWELEYQTGHIEAAIATSQMAQQQWQGVMATYTVTTTADGVGAGLIAGSLRWAISQANANPGTDTIVFSVNGTFNMASLVNGDDNNNTGDFDITGSVNIVGNGSANTIINGNGLDRVFDLRGGTVSMSGLTIQGGKSSTGAGIRILSGVTATLTDVVVQNNVGSGASKGGGIYSDGSLTLRNTTVKNNGDTSDDVDGAGVYIDGNGSINALNVEFSGNVAANNKDGGGLYLKQGTSGAVLENVTFANNLAKNGAGLFSSNNNTSLVNVTLSDNTATAQGGAIWTDKTLSLDHVTVAANSAPAGGGVWDDKGGLVTTKNSLFAGNTGGNANLALVSAGYNLSNDNSAGFTGTGDQKNVAAGVLALASNGGYTRTVAITLGSNARNAANPVTALTADQRGVAYFGGRADIGAYEYSNSLPTGSVTISGTPTQGQTLTASNSLADADGLGAISYQWKAGGTNIAGATGATYVLTQSEVGKTITVVASYTDGGGTAESVSSAATAAVANINDAPTGSVTISGTATQGQTLTAANSLADADGLGTISYQWKADGVAISGATGSTLLLAQAQVGKVITVVASYTDGYGTNESVSSAATAAVANVNDAPTGSVTITGTATQGQTLTAANSLADADGLGTISYQWKADGVAISGATGSTLLLAQAQVGKAITVTASYTDGGGTAESVSSAATAAVTNVNDAPTGSVTISGTATQGQTLTAANSLADADGLGTISYQWKADGVAISGATGSTLLLAQAQVGKVITVVASYTDGFGTNESVSSAATAAVANVNDAPTGSVTISGTPTQGQTLTAANSLADADGLGTISYQWKADGVAISGATGSTLLLAQAQVGKVITVVASYTDGFGTAESVTSNATAAVANVNDAPTGTLTINGTPTRGNTLTFTNTLADADGLGTISYQWAASGTNIAGATGSSYVLTPSEDGKTITVTASYTDGYGTNESVTSAATAAVTPANAPPTGSVTITGTPTQGQTLTAANTLADADGPVSLSIAYQWFADGSAISGATGSTLLLAQAQVGTAITVTASYTDDGGTAESVSSAATAAVANINDAPSGSVTISGTPTQGQTLTAANSLADADGLGTISYQWSANGVAISGATDSTLLLAQAQVGKVITVAASYTDGYGTAESVTSAATAVVANVNDAPTGSVTIGGTPTQGQTLTASNSLADIDGLGTISYQWNANGVAISGATGSTLLLEQAQVGEVITVTASYTDGFGINESVSSAVTSLVANINDAPTGSVTISGTPTQGQTLTAANSLADADGLGTISYQWSANGVAISGATGSTLLLEQAQVGKTITVAASYTDGFGTNESVSSAATSLVANINDAPTGSVTISGTPTQGQTLTAANSLADADGLGTINYQWQRGGINIAGATGATYTTTQSDVGAVLRVVASYTDGQGTAESVASVDTAAVANINDAPTGSVTISGTPTQGQTLTAVNSLADADGLGPISYQWSANGVAISGATGTTLLLAQAQVGKVITVTASYVDGLGTAESVSSGPTGAVSAVNTAPTGSVTITGTPTQGQTLTAANSLADADGLGTISYQWSANGVAISGATGSTLLLAQAQVGKVITVTASYVDGLGTAESVSSGPIGAVSAVNTAPTGSVTITGTPTQGQTLTAANSLADADGLGPISYQWSANGVAISGATGTTLLLAQTQVGKVITVTARYTDGGGTAESVTSAATIAVANINDVPTGSVTISGTPTQGQTLTAANSLADADGLGPISYQWSANGVAISGATGTTLLLAQTQVGKVITVTARYTDGGGTAESVTSAATIAVANINDVPTGSVTISGTPTQGQTLTAANSLADADGLGTISYQWSANGVAISGATGTTLLLAQTQVGKVITVTARYTDGGGTAESVTSAATIAVANINDVPTGSVTISGTPTQGQTLTAANSLADADGLGTISYHWSANGVAISGATGSTLLLAQAQVGKVITVTASYVDGLGTAESVSSGPTNAIILANRSPISTPVADQSIPAGTVFAFNLPAGSISDPDLNDTLTFRASLASGEPLPTWLQFDASTQQLKGIAGFTDVGSIRVQITATDRANASVNLVFTLTVFQAPAVQTAVVVAGVPEVPTEPTAASDKVDPLVAKKAAVPVIEVLTVGSSGPLLANVERPDLVTDLVERVGVRADTAVIETTVIPASRADAVLAEALTTQFSQMTLQSFSNLVQNKEILSQFDEMKRQMSVLGDQKHALIASSVALSSGLSIGYVIWLVRGGVLMSSMLSALPAWQMIDPLPVLAAAKSKKRKSNAADPNSDQSAESLFDRKSGSTHSPRAVAPVIPVDASEPPNEGPQ